MKEQQRFELKQKKKRETQGALRNCKRNVDNFTDEKDYLMRMIRKKTEASCFFNVGEEIYFC